MSLVVLNQVMLVINETDRFMSAVDLQNFKRECNLISQVFVLYYLISLNKADPVQVLFRNWISRK